MIVNEKDLEKVNGGMVVKNPDGTYTVYNDDTGEWGRTFNTPDEAEKYADWLKGASTTRTEPKAD